MNKKTEDILFYMSLIALTGASTIHLLDKTYSLLITTSAAMTMMLISKLGKS